MTSKVVIGRILARIRYEPVILGGLALAVMQAIQSAPSGLEWADLGFVIVDAVVVWGMRELVYPAVKVKEDPTLTVERPLPPPVMGEAP